MQYRADSRLAPSQWETSLQSNAVSHWLGANLEWALQYNRPAAVEPRRVVEADVCSKCNSAQPLHIGCIEGFLVSAPSEVAPRQSTTQQANTPYSHRLVAREKYKRVGRKNTTEAIKGQVCDPWLCNANAHGINRMPCYKDILQINLWL